VGRRPVGRQGLRGLGVKKPVATFELRLDFQLFAAVRTLDIGLGAETIFTQRGKASWYFDGTGTVANGVWTPAAQQAKTAGDSKFVEVVGGAVVPNTTGATFNAALAGVVWETKVG